MILEIDSCPPLSFLSPKGATKVLFVCLGSGGEGKAGWEVVTLVLAFLYPVFSLSNLPKSGQQNSCQPRGRFLELLPLSWKCQPAAEARRISIIFKWVDNPCQLVPNHSQLRRHLDGTARPSELPDGKLCCIMSTPSPHKSNSYVTIEFLGPIYLAGILAEFDCICTLIMVF